jgi:hypothetical protein
VDPVDHEAISEELRRVRVTFRQLVDEASPDDLARASSGTRWTNQQLLFHMLLGYLITPALIVLAGTFARLPADASRVYAGLLNAATSPFDWVNYLGSCAGARAVPQRRLAGTLDRVTLALERRLRAETSTQLRSGMHYPVRWDPFFKDFMTLADIYHFPTQHFDFHQRQLTLDQSSAKIPSSRGPGTGGHSATRSLKVGLRSGTACPAQVSRSIRLSQVTVSIRRRRRRVTTRRRTRPGRSCRSCRWPAGCRPG